MIDCAAAARNSRQSYPHPDSELAAVQAGEPALAMVNVLLDRTSLEAFSLPLSSARLKAPIPRPGKIVAIGLNYRDHCVEQGIDPPSTPLIFAKFPTSITGPYDPIVLPEGDVQANHEAELGVVIGHNAIRVNADDHEPRGRLARSQRRLGSQAAIFQSTMGAGKVLRHLLPDRTLADDEGRNCRPSRLADL